MPGSTRRKVPFERILAPGDGPVGRPREAAYRVAAEEPYDGHLLPEERDALFEVAAMMARASGPLSMDEAGALADLVTHLQGEEASLADVATLLREAERRRRGADVEERLRELAGQLRRQAVRELVYKAAYAIRVSDLAANDDEADLDALLVETFGLEDAAGALASEVNEALLE